MAPRLPTYSEQVASGQAVRTATRQARQTDMATTTSVPINLKGELPVGVVVLDAWTAANIGFDISIDGITYFPVYDHEGNRVVVEVPAVNTYIALPTQYLLAAPYIRLRSLDTVSATPLTQASARDLILFSVP